MHPQGCLSDGKVRYVILNAPDRAQANNQVAQNVSHAGIALTSSHIGDPLPVNRGNDRVDLLKSGGAARALVGNAA